MIELTIDDQVVSCAQEASIIEAADAAGIYIPRFCYHKKLSVAANCRMCLVEVDQVNKPLPACATPVAEGMKVYTQSQAAREAQRSVMEFLLIHHPLDCPICDQGGECELQDLSLAYGAADSRYDQAKRAVFSDDIGPLIETEMTRCIHCTRCVRFGEEIAGLRELGMTWRGEHSEIGTYVRHMMQSELSGNVIDLCPVGALTAKPSRYSLRAWEVREHPTIAPHDCVGTNLFVHSKGQDYSEERWVMRAVPRENEAINEIWMSDRDRFSYEGLSHADRCLFPMMKQAGEWVVVPWSSAIAGVAERLSAVIEQEGAHQIAALSSPSATLEECYLLQKWWRALGSHHIDHRLREQDMSDQDAMLPLLMQGIKIADIEQLDVIFLVGSHVRVEQPIISHRIHQAVLRGARVIALNPVDYVFPFPCHDQIITADLTSTLAQILVARLAASGQPLPPALSDTHPSAEATRLADVLGSAKNAAVFLGAFAAAHPHAAYLRRCAVSIAQPLEAHVTVLTEGANALGAYLAGAVPHGDVAGAPLSGVDHPRHTAKTVLVDEPVSAYCLLGFEPEYDTIFPDSAMAALQAADCVICLAAFTTAAMKQVADIILPIAPFTENEGTLINVEGKWQSFEAAIAAKGQSKPAWKIIHALARAMQPDVFDYPCVEAVRDTVSAQVQAHSLKQTLETDWLTQDLPPPLSPPAESLLLLAVQPPYRIDPILRRASALQAVSAQQVKAHIALNEREAQARGYQAGDLVTAVQGDMQITLPLAIDPRLADAIVAIPVGLPDTLSFAAAVMAPVQLRRSTDERVRERGVQ